MVMYKKNASRKNNMRKSRKSRKSRKGRKGRRGMRGGAYNPQELSYAQGQQFNALTKNYHGGAHTPLGGAPVGDQGLLPQELRDSARIMPLDTKSQEIVGMNDSDHMASPMTGGRRKNRKSRKNMNMRKSRKSRKSRKVRKARKTRKN